MIKVLAFDLGDTVLTDDWNFQNKAKIDDFKKTFKIKKLKINKKWIDICIKINRGKITENEYWKRFLEIYQAQKVDIPLAKKIWKKHMKEHEHMLKLLERLRKRKIRMISITAIGREWLNYKIKKFHLNKYFEFFIPTYETGISKQNPKIYKIAIKKLGIKPSECLFIDNSISKILAAKLAGMKTIHFKGQKDLEIKLKKIGIL